MNHVVRETLARGVDRVPTPSLDVTSLVARGERRLRRRRRTAIAATALAVALAMAAPSVWGALDDGPHAVDRPGPVVPSPRDDVSSSWTKPLVWAEGPQLHVGDRQVDTGFIPLGWDGTPSGYTGDALSVLRATTGGAVFATLDGRIFFSDGTSVELVGRVPSPRIRPRSVSYPAGRPETWIMTESSGPRAVWIENSRSAAPQIVILDTSTRRLRRLPVRLPAGHEMVETPELLGDHVYWEHHVAGFDSSGPLMRTDLRTGRSEPAKARTRDEEGARLEPALLLGIWRASERDGAPLVVSGGRLHAIGDLDSGEDQLGPVRDATTSGELEIRAPRALERAGELRLFEWLDEDSFALSPTPDWGDQERDIAVCRISTRACEIAVHNGRGPYLVLPWTRNPG